MEAGFRHLASLVLHREFSGDSNTTTPASAAGTERAPAIRTSSSSVPAGGTNAVRMALREPSVSSSAEPAEMVVAETKVATESDAVVLGGTDNGLMQVWDLDDF